MFAHVGRGTRLIMAGVGFVVVAGVSFGDATLVLGQFHFFPSPLVDSVSFEWSIDILWVRSVKFIAGELHGLWGFMERGGGVLYDFGCQCYTCDEDV